MPTIKSDAVLLIEAGVNLPDNTTQLITPAALREMVEDLINSKINSSGFSGITGILEYTTDLSGLYTDRTLVDKEYVDLQLTAINEWGNINGDINDQADLITLFDTKLNIDGSIPMTGSLNMGGSFIGNVSNIQDTSGNTSVDIDARVLVDNVGNYIVDYGSQTNGLGIRTSAWTAFFKTTALTANRIFQMPDQAGTIALTSDLSSYLPLTGGTLIGNLNGVTPTELGYLSGATSNIQNQINNINAGLSWKTAVRVATTANITLSGAQTIDGISVIAGDRVLVKNQSTASQNGFYLCAAGSWTRTTDANTGATILQATVSIEEGTVNADTIYTCTTDAPITIGSTSISFAKTSATTYTSSNGITLTGNNFTLDNSYFTGDITISGGVTTIGATKVTNAMLSGSIAYSKLSLTGAILNADLAGSIDLTTKVTGLLPGANGGTGVNNGIKTITLGGNLVTTGSFNLTISVPQTTTYTLPNTASETLAGLGTAQTFSAIQTFADNILSSATTNTKNIGSTTNVWASVFSRILAADTLTGTNVAGPSLTLGAGIGTGSGAASSIIFQTTTALSSGSTTQTRTTRLTIDSTRADFTVPVRSSGIFTTTGGYFTTGNNSDNIGSLVNGFQTLFIGTGIRAISSAASMNITADFSTPITISNANTSGSNIGTTSSMILRTASQTGNTGGATSNTGGISLTTGNVGDPIGTSGSINLTIGTGPTRGSINIGGDTTTKIGFYGGTAIVQPTTAFASATLVSNGGTALTDTDTFDGYTLKQIVKIIRSLTLAA